MVGSPLEQLTAAREEALRPFEKKVDSRLRREALSRMVAGQLTHVRRYLHEHCELQSYADECEAVKEITTQLQPELLRQLVDGTIEADEIRARIEESVEDWIEDNVEESLEDPDDE